MKNLSYILFLLTVLSSCFKEEEPRQAFTSYKTLELGNEYYNQIFYSLPDTSIISTNNYLDWNLAFYSGSDKSFIKLNAAANMWVIKTNSTNFNDSFSSIHNESAKRFDGSHGLDDNLAIDQVLSANSINNDTIFGNNEVYLIHPGIKANGDDIGEYKKFVFVGVYNENYIIKYANLNGSDEKTIAIPKNSSINYVSFSWLTHEIVDIEPNKTTWDLLFTRYSDTVYTSDGSQYLTGYAVTGAYLNEYNKQVKAYIIDDIPYNDITLQNIDVNKLSTNYNVIGHTWKQFSNQYSIFPNMNYIIQDRNGNLYKLRFLSFYDPISGQKGYPSFEFILL